MDEAKNKVEDGISKEEHVRAVALSLAIKANAGTDFNDMGQMLISSDKIVEAAKKFEKFLKGE